MPIETAARAAARRRRGPARRRRPRRPAPPRTARSAGWRSGSRAPGRAGRRGPRRPPAGAGGRAPRPPPPRRRRRRRRGCRWRRRPCRRRRPAARPRPRSRRCGPSRLSSATSPAALWPNRKFSPTTTSAACRCSTSTSCTNASARQPGELRRERDHAQHVDAERLDQLGLAGRLGEHRRVRAGPHHLGRVRVEGHHDRADAQLPGALHGVPDGRLVSPVDAVEDADRDHRPAPAAGRRLVPPPPLHASQPRVCLCGRLRTGPGLPSPVPRVVRRRVRRQSPAVRRRRPPAPGHRRVAADRAHRAAHRFRAGRGDGDRRPAGRRHRRRGRRGRGDRLVPARLARHHRPDARRPGHHPRRPRRPGRPRPDPGDRPRPRRRLRAVPRRRLAGHRGRGVPHAGHGRTRRRHPAAQSRGGRGLGGNPPGRPGQPGPAACQPATGRWLDAAARGRGTGRRAPHDPGGHCAARPRPRPRPPGR